MLKVVVDTREPRDIYEFLVKSFPDITFMREKLDEGDYLAMCDNGKKRVLVERKQIGDFYDSIIRTKTLKDGTKSNRMRNQVDKISICQSDCVVLYLITGDQNSFAEYMRNQGNPINMDIIDGGISSLLVRDNIRVLIDYSDKGGIKRMVRVMKKICDDETDLPKVRNVNTLAARLLNISKKQWFALREKFGTDLVYISGLSEREIMKVEGIGKIKAKRIKEILNGTSEDWL